MKKHKYTVINNEIVYANWFLRQLDAIWDFIYFHILPLRTWHKLGEIKRSIIYAFERAFYGYDRTISWGYESTIKFYKKLLGDLHKYCHGFPSNLKEICPEEWKEIEKKYASKCNLDEASKFCGIANGLTEEEHNQLSDDMFNAWKAYIARILHYLNEADEETCSEKNELVDQFKWNREENREIVERNGEYFYSYPPVDPTDPQEQINKKIFDRDVEIEQYRMKNLNLAMQEITKNLIYLAD